MRGLPEPAGPLPDPLIPPEARAGLDALVRQEPRFGAIERAAGPLPWRVRPQGFPGLLQAIVAQQVSSAAARAIWGRLRTVPGALEPDGLMRLPDDVLGVAGLSRPKMAGARALAEAFASGRLGAEVLAGLDDDAAVAAITAVRGLGPWTAEVYLLFALGRADVFPAGDVALAGAAADLFGLAVRPGPRALGVLAEPWQPRRALAARLLWHHWRFLTGRAAMDDAGTVLPGA